MAQAPRKNRDHERVGGLPRPVYVVLRSRIAQGTAFCLLRHRTAYQSVAHLLDEYGVVKKGMEQRYGGLIRKYRSAIDRDPSLLKRVLYARLLDHLKKNRNRRGVRLLRLRGAGSEDERCARHFGYTVSELIAHMERLFTEGMNWDRVLAGDVQIDHVIPIRIFNLAALDGVKRAYALSNTQPLWRGENARKSQLADKSWDELFGAGSL